MKINTRIYETNNKLYKNHEEFMEDFRNKEDKRRIKNIIQCHHFNYQGKNIGYIEFKNEDKEFYKQQLTIFPEDKWVSIEIDDSKTRIIPREGSGTAEPKWVLKFTEKANFKESTDEFRFKVKDKDRVGHIDYRDTRMIIDIEEENLNDYPAFKLGLWGHRLYLECPNKQSFAEFFNYIKVGEEYVVDLRDIKYNHTWNGNTGDITYRVYQDPNGKKVIRKVGEESVPKKFPDQQEAKKIAEFCKRVREEINEVLNQDPVVFSSELSDNNWGDLLSSTKTEQEINELKDRVLADTETKRNAKKGKRKRGDEKGEDIYDNNKKPNLDDEDKKNYEDFLKNGILNEVEDSKLKSGLEVAIRLEGEKEYDDEKTRKEIEEELWKRNPQFCRSAIITSLKERLKDNNISTDELSEEVKKLVNGEITNKDKVKTVKEQAIKEIGQKGAERKWTTLFNKAKSFLEEAKKSITEKLKKDLKIIQEQIKSLSSENNSYLASFYSSNKGQVETLEKSISTVLNQNQTGSEPKAVPWGIIIPVSLVVVAIVAVIVIVRKRRRGKII
ncbi:MAG: hypothetical protein MRERV_2c104 [Mycoplasmataceae bacterium RV_VA103A]|nr:MAG: hypothetical protein MRERV_2c104 [Mycoplasmataceae bacterium RV_VA103A]